MGQADPDGRMRDWVCGLVIFDKGAQHLGMDVYATSFDTPLGLFGLRESGGEITDAGWRVFKGAPGSALLERAQTQVQLYFSGELTQFDVPLRVEVGGIVPEICDMLLAIPFGETRTYGDLAKAVGRPAQAVGQACGRNPIPVIIPCHRVLGAKGLGGFSARGGVETKIELLKLEKAAGLLI